MNKAGTHDNSESEVTGVPQGVANFSASPSVASELASFMAS